MSKNDVTGDRLVTKASNSAYDTGYDRIFTKAEKTIGETEHITDVPKPPKGYTAEELERDNPYNQWMNEK